MTTVSPRPVQCRSGEPTDRELLDLVYRQERRELRRRRRAAVFSR